MFFSITVTTQPHSHAHAHTHPHADSDAETSPFLRIQRLIMFLEAHFGKVELHMPDAVDEERELGEDSHDPWLIVRLDEADAQINLLTLAVSSSNETLRKRVEVVLDMAVTTVSSLSESFALKVTAEEENGFEKEQHITMEVGDSPNEGEGEALAVPKRENEDGSAQEDDSEDSDGGLLEVHD